MNIRPVAWVWHEQFKKLESSTNCNCVLNSKKPDILAGYIPLYTYDQIKLNGLYSR